MSPSVTFTLPLLLFFLTHLGHASLTLDTFKRMSESPPTSDEHHKANGTKWAVLVAGSRGFDNYRHQADVCHAYQILKKGGLKDENIIVFMYDDIANNVDNPKKGVIINRPRGPNVYKGVPKDYTGDDVTASNLLAVILGDKKAVKGGSGKVLKSGLNDHIFIYYTDHGGSGVLGMPAGHDLYAKDLIETLKKKHAARSYSRMVVYVEACESGSIFDGLLPKRMNVYVTTASNPNESSYATYCPGEPGVPKEYDTCLGDLYSVAWMEDSDKENPKTETLEKQYQVVKKRTIGSKDYSSHVMRYGDIHISSDITGLYFGDLSGRKHNDSSDVDFVDETPLVSVDQREADIVHLRQKVKRAPEGSEKRAEAQRKLDDVLAQRKHVDQSVEKIGQLLFGSKGGQSVLNNVRPAGKPLVDDWDCLKSTVESYKAHCGSLDSYGKKYMRAFANICNAGVRRDAMAKAFSQACKK